MKTWLTSNTLFGSYSHLTNILHPRYSHPNTESMNELILTNINKFVKEDDVLICVGNVLDNEDGANWLPYIVCKNKICIMSKLDDNFSGYISPYFEMVEGFAKLDDVTLCYSYTYAKDITYNSHYSFCGSPLDTWKYNENHINVSQDVWNYKPVSYELLKLYMSGKTN